MLLTLLETFLEVLFVRRLLLVAIFNVGHRSPCLRPAQKPHLSGELLLLTHRTIRATDPAAPRKPRGDNRWKTG